MTFDEIIDFRASNRKFDPEVPVPSEVIEKALKHATLAPNSSNMQLWEFHWTKSPEAKAKIEGLFKSNGGEISAGIGCVCNAS